MLHYNLKRINKHNTQDKFIFLVYSLYFVLKPFYFWSSGLPQIADIIMISIIIFFLIKNNFKIYIDSNQRKVLFIGLLFVTYVTFINLVWSLILNAYNSFIQNSLYYIYNYILVVFVLALYTECKRKIIEITYKSALISVCIQIIIYIVGGGFTGSRMTGGFNNPNQLGYYSLLIGSILMFSSQRITVQAKWLVLGLIASIILALSSLSSAAIISYIGMLLFFFISKNGNIKFKRNFLLIILFTLGISTYVYHTAGIFQESQLIHSVKEKLESTGEKEDDSLEGRGYNRITEHPEYWLFGSGEGGFSRFSSFFEGMEFHSTLGNIQVSYGIIGTILFISFIILALVNDRYRSWYIILFILIYGLTHNGIRNGMFWILLGLVASASVFAKEDGRKEINNDC